MREPRPGHAAGPQIIPTGGFEDKDNPYTRAFVKNYRKGVYHAKEKIEKFLGQALHANDTEKIPELQYKLIDIYKKLDMLDRHDTIIHKN